MKREILFRFWHEEEKKFYYFKNGFHYSDLECKNQGCFLFDWNKSEQFTTVKDLFENDIFHLGDPDVLYQVVWHDAGFMGLKLESNTHKHYVGLKHHEHKIVKVGSIHDIKQDSNDNNTRP
jgi:hypothetical protein